MGGAAPVRSARGPGVAVRPACGPGIAVRPARLGIASAVARGTL